MRSSVRASLTRSTPSADQRETAETPETSIRYGAVRTRAHTKRSRFWQLRGSSGVRITVHGCWRRAYSPDVELGAMLSFSSRDDSMSSAVDLVTGLWMRPFVTAHSKDPSLADGVAKQLTDMFSGRSRFGWQGLRRPGEVTLLRGLRTRAGWLVTVAVTAAVTAVITIYLTKVLT